MLVLNELNVLDFKIALVTNAKSVGALGLFNVLIQLLLCKNSALGALVWALEEVFWTLALQVVEIVIIAELAFRSTLFALEGYLIEYLFYN